ncbi:hypothetical protein HNR30_005079 [Nonomuraea soli]|uniref:Uncharacterized protein n=1 Tax=Nonomuraea soli TaxID=1032476 RepID=A0A7W0CM67_9ACTN|nr:hypothetical protein [Nonomuraea soli]
MGTVTAHHPSPHEFPTPPASRVTWIIVRRPL